MDRCLISDKLGEFPHIFWQDMAQEFGASQELCNRGNELTPRLIATFNVKVKITPLYPSLCDLLDYTVHEILLIRILEWIAVPSSRASSQPRDLTQLS